MKETKRLIQILSRFGPKKLPLLDQLGSKYNTLEKQLYENLKADKYRSEKEALLDLYGSEADYHKYRMLKSRLKQKLYNHLLFVENSTIISVKEEKYCLDLLHKGNILLTFGEHNLAVKLFQKVVRVAKKFEFTDIHTSALHNLSMNYSELFDHSKFNEALTELKELSNKKSIEDEAYIIYLSAKMALRTSVRERRKFLPKLPEVISKLHSMWKRSNSYNIFRNYYFLKKWYFELIGDFESYLSFIDDVLSQLRNGELNQFRFDMRAHYYSHIYGLTRVKQYEKGLTLAAHYLEAFHDNTRNWFAYLGNYVVLALHAKNYLITEEIIERIFTHRNFSKLPKHFQENFFLYKAFLILVFPQTRIQDIKHQNYFNFSFYSKDKLGHNISILILQFLYLLKKRDLEQLTSKEETYRKYANTYLKNPYSKRSYYLFKLMLCIIRADFDLGKIVEKGKTWLEKLKHTPEPGDAYSSIEIVPYENLWEVMLQYLQENKSVAVCS